MKGKRNCPPGDCGSVYGYDRILEALENPDEEENEELLEWLGYDYDPEFFDAEDTNLALMQLTAKKSGNSDGKNK